jgi:hypothetical protein
MKTLKHTAFILLVSILLAPCLLILNEQPESEPQNWWVNAIGFAWIGALTFLCKRYEKRQSQKS